MSVKYKGVEISFEEYKALREAGVWTHFEVRYAINEGRPYPDSLVFYTRTELEQDE